MTAPGKDLEILSYPVETVEKGDILVRVNCCTICGSDIHSWRGRRPAPVPIILGHEIVGTILEMGTEVMRDGQDQELQVGDRITWTVTDSCGRCYFCRVRGLPMKCRDLKKYGHERCDSPPHFKGGFAEYCYISSGTCMFKIPEEIPDIAAAPANCALATVVAGLEAAQIRPFENILIQGAGALGIYAAALASHMGCRKILVADINKDRLEFVRSFGATDVLDAGGMSPGDMADEVRAMTRGLGVDCVAEVAGAPELIPAGLACLRTGGRLVEIGNSFPGAVFSLDASDLVYRRLTVCGIHNYDAKHLFMGIEFLMEAKSKFPFEKIVTHKYSLEDINKAFSTVLSGKAIRVAVIP